MRLGQAVGLSERELIALQKGAVLHDIGKIGIPDAILLKPGPLGGDEWRIMRRHAEIGAELCIRLKNIQDAVPIIRHHHERWDGSGYPDGLSGERIPRVAQVFQWPTSMTSSATDAPTAARKVWTETPEILQPAVDFFNLDITQRLDDPGNWQDLYYNTY